MDHVDRQLGCLPLRQTVEVESGYKGKKLGFDNYVEKLGFDHGVEKLRLDHEMCRALECC